MKRLYLMRHAKSSWKDETLKDYERPLNKRGKRDAPFMGKVLKKKGVSPDVIISSFAKRAYKTAKKVAKELGVEKERIIKDRKLYLIGFAEFLDYVKNLDDGYESVLIVGHNPGISELFSYLSGKESLSMPTAAVGGVEFKSDRWRDIDESKRKVLFFEYPKKFTERQKEKNF